ncbi:MAG: hypothetical protein IT366_12165 [Candidatus Hydrogenedentes bacterium]|nr:hypothetical protein [Candidatus Hydrogenedentota bacterium]
MAPVIRIPDEIFARLQQLAEPLVDTPATVIRKLLDAHESGTVKSKEISSASTDDNLPIFRSEAWKKSPCQNLFLAPATTKNLKATLEHPIPIKLIESAITAGDQDTLRNAIGMVPNVRCFAVQESSASQFHEMSAGDLVLFAEEGTGKFEYAGRVIAKLRRKELGTRLWNDPSWSLIYFLDPEQTWRIKCDKKSVIKECGYDENFWLPKFMQVRRDPIAHIKTKYGSLAQFLVSNQI